MNWSNSLTLHAFNESWLNWKTKFGRPVNSRLTFLKFYEMGLKGSFSQMSINDLENLKIENMPIDVQPSIESFNNAPSEPIVLFKIRDYADRPKLFILNGEEKIILARTLNSEIGVWTIDGLQWHDFVGS